MLRIFCFTTLMLISCCCLLGAEAKPFKIDGSKMGAARIKIASGGGADSSTFAMDGTCNDTTIAAIVSSALQSSDDPISVRIAISTGLAGLVGYDSPPRWVAYAMTVVRSDTLLLPDGQTMDGCLMVNSATGVVAVVARVGQDFFFELPVIGGFKEEKKETTTTTKN